MRVLLTSPRAPVTLDLARRLSVQGHQVFVADSLRFPVGAFSRHCRLLSVPRPNANPKAYVDRLQEIVKAHQIDWLIPTCEEVFTIAAFKDRLTCNVFIDSFEKLKSIHNKWTFSQTASNEFASVPESRLLSSQDQLTEYSKNFEDYVFKPCYSRFASETMISPSFRELQTIEISAEKHWIAQKRVIGTEYSTYSVAVDGKLMAHACYSSRYRAGKGSGIYFVPESNSQIQQFVNEFVLQFGYTGQIGFDCIVDESNGVWILEGNPRATSGLHLFGDDQPLTDSLLGNNQETVLTQCNEVRMLGAAMPIWGLGQAVMSFAPLQFVGDFFRGNDVLFQWSDPLPFLLLPLTMGELAILAMRESASLQKVSTRDIEWNGGPL